jgi:hypothetical protein
LNASTNIANYREVNGRFTGKVFTEFAKGVTYFRNEYDPDSDPKVDGLVYHRDASCGPKSVTSKNKFGHLKTDMTDEKEVVYRCYLERLIYDELFIHYGTEQDYDHQTELLNMRRIFEELYPEHLIHINIGYDLTTNYPIQLFVHFTTDSKKQQFLYTEVYRKTVYTNCNYGDTIDCERHDHTTGKKYMKMQTFDHMFDWEEVTM